MKHPYETCPICESLLVFEDNKYPKIFDGNKVYQCTGNKDHRFWKNARDIEYVLRLNKNASKTSFGFDKEFFWNKETNKWEENNEENK